MTRLALIVLLVLTAGCQRERSRAVQEVGAQGTRATHTRDRAEEAARWNDAAGPELPPLEPVADTPLALGKIEVLAAEDGVELQRQPWSFHEIRGVSYRVRIPRDRARLRVVAAKQPRPLRELVGTIDGKQSTPWAAINGGFYDVDKSAMGLVVAAGEEVSELRKNGGSGIVTSRHGTIAIEHRNRYEPGADEALQSIDRIVAEGESLMTEGRRERHTTRSAIAVGKDYVWLVLAAEEESFMGDFPAYQLRSTSFRGLPLWAFARYLLETTDTVDALNLDGAVSSELEARVASQELGIRGEMGTINALILDVTPPDR